MARMTRKQVAQLVYELWGFAMVYFQPRNPPRVCKILFWRRDASMIVLGEGNTWLEAFEDSEKTRAALETLIGSSLASRKQAYIEEVGEGNEDCQKPTFTTEELLEARRLRVRSESK